MPEIWPVRPCAEVAGAVPVTRRTVTTVGTNQRATGPSFASWVIVGPSGIPV
jgi:hypothetical protein